MQVIISFLAVYALSLVVNISLKYVNKIWEFFDVIYGIPTYVRKFSNLVSIKNIDIDSSNSKTIHKQFHATNTTLKDRYI